MAADDEAPGAIPDEAIDRAILCLCRARGRAKTICPSEAARALVSDEAGWRALMGRVRKRAAALAGAGEIECLQKGERVDELWARGPIRLRLRGCS